jgi:hypothetical protein
MLFDLSSPRRKNVVRVVYGALALLFAGGFIFFGIGSEGGGGGLFDGIFGDGGGGGSTAEQFEQQVEDAENALEEDPADERALVNLVQYRALSGQTQMEVDEATGQPIGLTEESREEFEKAIEAWNRYVDTDPRKVDTTAATSVVNAYRFLGDASGAAAAQEILAEADPSTNAYVQLAFFRYADFDLKGGDEAADLALEEATPAQEKQANRILDQYREAAVKAKKQSEKQAESGAGESELDSPFGGLSPDSGLPPTAP